MEESKEDDKIFLFHSHLINLPLAHIIGKGHALNCRLTNVGRSHSHCFKKEPNMEDISIRSLLYIADPAKYTPRIYREDIFEFIDCSLLQGCTFVDCKFTNCILPRANNGNIIEESCVVTSDFCHPNIESLLGHCLVDNEPLGKFASPPSLFSTHLTNTGILISQKLLDMEKPSDCYDQWNHFLIMEIFKSKKSYCIDRILNLFSAQLNKKKKLPPVLPERIKKICHYQIVTDCKSNGIEVRSQEERIAEVVKKIRQEIKQDPTLTLAIKKLSEMLKDGALEKDNFEMTGGRQGELMKLRRQLGVPFVVDQYINTYGRDLSFLDFSNSVLIDKQLKDFYFSSADLTATRFIRCEFSSCDFTCADLSGTVFIDCKFYYCRRFLETTRDENTKFINCTKT